MNSTINQPKFDVYQLKRNKWLKDSKLFVFKETLVILERSSAYPLQKLLNQIIRSFLLFALYMQLIIF